MIVVTVFLSILNQMEIQLVQNRKENCHHDHIPFNLKGKEMLVSSVQLSTLTHLVRWQRGGSEIQWYPGYQLFNFEISKSKTNNILAIQNSFAKHSSTNIYFKNFTTLKVRHIPTYEHADPPLKSVPYQKVIVNGAQCYESNRKNNKKILRVFFFELSSKIGVIFSEKLH